MAVIGWGSWRSQIPLIRGVKCPSRTQRTSNPVRPSSLLYGRERELICSFSSFDRYMRDRLRGGVSYFGVAGIFINFLVLGMSIRTHIGRCQSMSEPCEQYIVLSRTAQTCKLTPFPGYLWRIFLFQGAILSFCLCFPSKLRWTVFGQRCECRGHRRLRALECCLSFGGINIRILPGADAGRGFSFRSVNVRILPGADVRRSFSYGRIRKA